MRVCIECKKEKEISLFYKRRNICIDCNIEVTIKTKKCSKCNITKESFDFNKDDRSKDGLLSSCKDCVKEYRENNKEKIKKYRENNKEKLKQKKKEYYLVYKENNKDKIKESNKKYKQNNKEKINNYYLERKRNDSFFKLKSSIRNLLYHSFKRKFSNKSKRTIEILGCSFDEFRQYIENKFNDNMTWENYGIYWEYDHIIQLATALNEDDLLRLNHYTNFQPLEIDKNRSKNFKY